MNNDSDEYLVSKNNTIRDVLQVFQTTSSKNLPTGIAIVIDNSKKVIGSISEGDIRRALLSDFKLDQKIGSIYEKNPICFSEKYSYKEILEKIPNELQKRNRKSNRYLNKIIITNGSGKLDKVLGYHELWEQRVATHRHIVVLGLGYVGLTMALVLAEEGFLVTGVDADDGKINELNSGGSYIHEKGIQELLNSNLKSNFVPTCTIPNEGDVFIIAVGTPVVLNSESGKTEPVLDYIKEIAKQVGKKLNAGNLVILRSTVPTGLTRDVVLPLLEEYSEMKCGKDFHLVFAPERTAEGKALKELRELPQVIGGINHESVEAAAALFRELTSTIVRVSSLEVAEMTKLVNNSYRDIVFSYSNYICQIASKYNLDISEVIKAANQGYPRNRVPFPSPGVGGPCLTKDPHIFALSCDSKVDEIGMTLFEYGRSINESMHNYVVSRVKKELSVLGKDIINCKILVCGLAFKGKPETGDVRNSSSVEIYQIIGLETENIYGHDPVASCEDIIKVGVRPVTFDDGMTDADAVLFLNNNRYYEDVNIVDAVKKMSEHPIIFDGWNLYRPDEVTSIRPSVYMNLSQVKSSI